MTTPEIKTMLEAMQREEEIRCPFCDHLQSNDDQKYPVTYWAETGPQEMECDFCSKLFFVEEHVRRTYTIGKTAEEADA